VAEDSRTLVRGKSQLQPGSLIKNCDRSEPEAHGLTTFKAMTGSGASLSCQLIAAKVGNQHPILPFENRE
jgi:hypothetical protein